MSDDTALAGPPGLKPRRSGRLMTAGWKPRRSGRLMTAGWKPRRSGRLMTAGWKPRRSGRPVTERRDFSPGGLLARSLALALAAVLAGGSVAGQESKPPDSAAEAPGLTGTWVMLLQGHQVGLEIEQKETALTGTLYIMGQRVPVDGEMTDRVFTLASDSQVGDANGHTTVPIKITGTHKPDDTLEGEIGMPRGPMTWTAERLKKPREERSDARRQPLE